MLFDATFFMMRYKVSQNITFLPAEEFAKANHIREFGKAAFVLKDRVENREFLVNETIKIFIEKFSVPKTFLEVNEEIAAEVNAPADEVKKIILPFFKHARYRHFIVPEKNVAEKTKTSPLFNPDTILDAYKIEKIIDVNGAIDVYNAIDLRKENSVVIKLLKQPKKKQAEALKREFDFLKALKKTGATPDAYVFKTREKYSYFVQDFIDGLSIPQFIYRRRKASRAFIFNLISNILDAFKKIHAQNILHGDIHPSNIIITHENKIKVIDFGLAVHTELDKDEIVNFGGAYFFMPPERIKKTTYKKFTRKPDFYSDVFQLGVVLYVFLYNAHPFNGITWEELATEIKGKEIQFPQKSYYNFSVPGWAKKIIAKCVSKKPVKRFNNAEELYNAFSKNMINNARKNRPAVEI